MLSSKKKAEIITNFICSYCKMLACGINFEDEKCTDTQFFFTWPEEVSEDCINIDCTQFDDGTCADMLINLVNHPKDTGLDAVKKFVVYAAAMGWIDKEEVDDIEVDWWYEDLDESRKMLPIKLYAKPKVGQVWSAQTANKLISDTVNRMENNMNRAIERFSGYAEV